MKRLGAALLPVVLAGLERRGPQAGSLDRPAATLARAHALGDVSLRDGKVAWRAFFRTEPETLEAWGCGSRRRARRRGASMGPGACAISQCVRAPEGRLLPSALR
jgi:hypothetical protein